MRARAALNDSIDEEEVSERKKKTEGGEKSKYGGRERKEKGWVRIGGGGERGVRSGRKKKEEEIDRDQQQLPSVGCLRADFN